MSVTKLSETTYNRALEHQALEARQWAIIINSVRELTYALGYTGPFRDNDLRIALAIKGAAARLNGPEAAIEAEHLPLVVPGAETPAEIGTIHDILERGLEAVLRAAEPSAAPAEPASPPKAPKPTQAKA